jgi:hypothetical protein
MFIYIVHNAHNIEKLKINTPVEEAAARIALKDAGLTSASIWHGDPEDPSAYPDGVSRLYAH